MRGGAKSCWDRARLASRIRCSSRTPPVTNSRFCCTNRSSAYVPARAALDRNGLPRRAGDERARTTFTSQLDAERRPERGRECDVLLNPGVQPPRAARRRYRRIKRAHELSRDIRVAGFDPLAHARRPRVRETTADLSRVVDASGNPIDAAEHANRDPSRMVPGIRARHG